MCGWLLDAPLGSNARAEGDGTSGQGQVIAGVKISTPHVADLSSSATDGDGLPCVGLMFDFEGFEGSDTEGCESTYRPETQSGVLAPFAVTARTKVLSSQPFVPDAPGEVGVVQRHKDGLGVNRPSCNTSPLISGTGSQKDEELIFTWDAPVPAASLVFEFNKVSFSNDDPVVFLSSADAAGFDHTVLEAEIQAAYVSTGYQKGNIFFSSFASLPAGLMVNVVKVRETNSQFFVSAVSTLVVCNDDNPCTQDTCSNGTCSFVPVTDGTLCVDEIFCNGQETCLSGVCSAGTDPCADALACNELESRCMYCLSRADCDDQNSCTEDSCLEGDCVHLANHNSCDDGDACTSGDACSEGACVSGGPLNCDDENACTADSCDSVSGCAHVDSSESCDDGDGCTDDYCDPSLGCVNPISTDPCNDGTPACDDCNLNGIRDGCDITNSELTDENGDGVPDECSQFDGACDGNNNWSCPGNWNLGGIFPDNGPGANFAVTLDHLDNAFLDISVDIDSLRLKDNSVLQVTQVGEAGNLTIVTDGGLLNEGIILTSGQRVIDLTCGPVTIRDGSYMPDPNAPPGTVQSVLNCETLTVLPGGTVLLNDSMTINAGVDVILNGTNAGPCTQDGGKSPPVLKIQGSSHVNVSGNVAVQGSGSFTNQSTSTVRIGGSFFNHSDSPPCFDSSIGRIVMQGAGQQYFEVAGEDLGATSAGFSHIDGHTNYSVGILEITGGGPVHQVTFYNTFANTVGTSDCQEALYVQSLILKAGSKITLDRVRLYYSELVDEGGSIVTVGCGLLTQAQQACVAPVECFDANACTFDGCVSGFCSHLAVGYGNVNGSGPVQPNLDDILCVLSGFANPLTCPNSNIVPCEGGPNITNLDDILAVLAAFSGTDPCGCAP